MSGVGVAQTAIPGGFFREEDSKQWFDERDSRISLADTFLAHYHETFDDRVAESWLPPPTPLWSNVVAPPNQWSHDASLIPRPFGSTLGEEQDDILYASNQDVANNNSQSSLSGPEQEFSRPPAENGHAYQPSPQAINRMSGYYRDTYPSQTPPTALHQPHQPSYTTPGASSFQIESTGYSELNNYVTEFIQKQPPNLWQQTSQEVTWSKSAIETNPRKTQPLNRLPLGLTLDWSACEQSEPSPTLSNSPSAAPVSKRRALSVVSTTKNNKSSAPQLSECVDVFENAPGALATVKRRKKLDAPVRKAAREVRKAGACHQCRFRKRTCSTGTPCGSCLKNGNGLHEIKCQRESPFLGKVTHEYFVYSSNRRVMSFDITIPLDSLPDSSKETVTIDGIGRLSHSFQLSARRITLKDLSDDARNLVRQTEDSKGEFSNEDDESILLLEDTEALGRQVEQWALEYTSKFVHAAGPKFYPTTIGQILGTMYVKKGLPESALVAAMLRVASVAFVLRAGVKFTTTGSKPSSRFRTIQAKIDTILYQRLQLAEKDLYQRLQRLIFRSAGCLTKEQVYPVALVLWQLLRFCCIAASHLSNIAQRFQSKVDGPAGYQHYGLKLVLSTHLALFRSSNPLLLDMADPFNQKLLEGDNQLVKLAMEMRKVVITNREKGFRDLKGSITYRKEYFDMFRKAYETK